MPSQRNSRLLLSGLVWIGLSTACAFGQGYFESLKSPGANDLTHYNPDNLDLKHLMSLGGGTVDFYINEDTVDLEDEDEGLLAFDIVSYSMEQKFHGGYHRIRNKINCMKGMYYQSPVREEVNGRGWLASGNLFEINGYAAGAMTLRNDGLSLYRNLKETCVDYSELDEELIRW